MNPDISKISEKETPGLRGDKYILQRLFIMVIIYIYQKSNRVIVIFYYDHPVYYSIIKSVRSGVEYGIE